MWERTRNSQYAFHGHLIQVRQDEVELPNGRFSQREVVEHPGAVGIVALTRQGEVVLIRQYRYSVQEVLWEIPAGKLDRGELPEACARRELEEETGYTAHSWQKIAEFFTSPGFSNEILHLYLARGLREGNQNLEPDEQIELESWPLNTALDKLATGQIRDAKTMVGLLVAGHYLVGEDGNWCRP